MRFSHFTQAGFCFVCACLAVFLLPTLAHGTENDPELTIVETACNKACTKGQSDKAFCQAYCRCIRSTVQEKRETSSVSSILKSERQQQLLIHQCSGETSVKFYAQSCRKTCKDAPKCEAYCACLQEKITKNRKSADIGAFFIKLGKNESSVVGQLKRYEALCMAQ